MEHFEITQWADFVRKVIPDREKSAMDRHLAEGCTECAHLKALMEKLYHEASREPVVPQELVDAAKNVFPSRAPHRLPSWLELPRLAAALVFDNLSPAGLQGSRGVPQSVVQAVYHAGDFAIELQAEREPESPGISLVGQVVNRVEAGAPLRGAKVVAVVRGSVVSTAQTNDFGEFCMAVKMQRGTTLCMHIEELGKCLEIPLNRVMAEPK
jgi:hypothetical protein